MADGQIAVFYIVGGSQVELIQNDGKFVVSTQVGEEKSTEFFESINEATRVYSKKCDNLLRGRNV